MSFPKEYLFDADDGVVLQALELEGACDVGRAYQLLSAGSVYSFWLDSAREDSPMSRFSYVGVVPEGASVVVCDDAREFFPGTEQHLFRDLDGCGRERSRNSGDFLSGLSAYLGWTPRLGSVPEELAPALLGGYVGYFGYELRAQTEPRSRVTFAARTPDAVWMQAVRYLVHDHQSGRQWLVGDADWLVDAQAALAGLAAGDVLEPVPGEVLELSTVPPSRADYTDKVRRCQREIYEGNSYEVCLTAQTSTHIPGGISKEQALATYLAQRAHNPAPYAAFFHCKDFFILSSSPERFLSVDNSGRAETKPIKGTVARSEDPVEDAARAAWLASDPKTRAENLMIVDLLRNDLSRVSLPGSVKVPVLMGVESYATVHQLVSTVSSQLRPEVGALEAAAACFPGGSMTGAPKPSTMDIIEGLEGCARGVYSGALGFFSASGSANLSIVIRTLVLEDSGRVTLSAGGAIVADSDPDAEYEEMLTKLDAALPRLD